MTPSWLETHASYINSKHDITTDQITFSDGPNNDAALLKVPLVDAGVLEDGTPLTVEMTVANDVSIGQTADSDIKYGVSDGTNFIGIETTDMLYYPLLSPCYGAEGSSTGESLTEIHRFGVLCPISSASFFPDQFVFTLKLDQPWGSCFTPHGGGFLKTASEYKRQLMASHGLTLEVYKSGKNEIVGIKHITITIMKTDG